MTKHRLVIHNHLRRFPVRDSASFWQQFTIAELERELSDWKRQLLEDQRSYAPSARANIRYAEKQITAIEKAIEQRRTQGRDHAYRRVGPIHNHLPGRTGDTEPSPGQRVEVRELGTGMARFHAYVNGKVLLDKNNIERLFTSRTEAETAGRVALRADRATGRGADTRRVNDKNRVVDAVWRALVDTRGPNGVYESFTHKVEANSEEEAKRKTVADLKRLRGATVTNFVWVRQQQQIRDATTPGVNDKNLAYDVQVRRMTTGADLHIRLFASSQEKAEERAKDRARQMERIPLDKYREYLRAGHAVFRIVSSKVSENQKPYSEMGYDAARDMHPDEIKMRIAELQKEMEKVIRSGGQIPMSDPLAAKLRGLKAELARAYNAERR